MSHSDLSSLPNLHIVEHPVVNHLLASIRNENTPPQGFREYMRTLGFMLGYEATRDLPLTSESITTPLETCPAKRISGPVTIVPILRAGLGLADGLIDLLPDARVAHVGMYRDEDKLVPVWYYQRIPPNIGDGPTIIVDPMLATGGSVCATIDLLRSHGCHDLRLVCLVAAPEGVAHVLQHNPDLAITTAAIDRELNERGFILPGLGDAGDRLYGTQ